MPSVKNSVGRGLQSSSEREVLARETASLYLSGGLLGRGPNSTEATLREIQAPYPKEAHNDYVAALVERERSGEGQGVELSLYESVLRVMEWTVAGFDRLGVVRARTGNRLANSAPLDNYATSDGRYVCIAAAGDVLFPRLAKAIGRPDLLEDERFSSLGARAQNADAINEIVAAWCAARPLDEIERTLVEAQVPVSGVYSIDQIVDDPQVRARDSIVTVEDPVLGPVRQQAPVPRLDRTPARIARGAPRLGEHNEEIYLGLLGMDRPEYDDLMRDGVV